MVEIHIAAHFSAKRWGTASSTKRPVVEPPKNVSSALPAKRTLKRTRAPSRTIVRKARWGRKVFRSRKFMSSRVGIVRDPRLACQMASADLSSGVAKSKCGSQISGQLLRMARRLICSEARSWSVFVIRETERLGMNCGLRNTLFHAGVEPIGDEGVSCFAHLFILCRYPMPRVHSGDLSRRLVLTAKTAAATAP